MGSCFQLQVKILQDFIIPAVEPDQVKKVAIKLGFGDSLTKAQVSKLYNTIVMETVDKIAIFLQSEEASQISHWAKQWDAFALSGDIGKQVKIVIKAHFHIVPESSVTSLLNWTWSWVRS